MPSSLIVKLGITLAVLILSLGVFFGSYKIGESQGKALCQADQDKAIVEENNKLEETYAKIDRRVPASRAKRVKWLLSLAKANGNS